MPDKKTLVDMSIRLGAQIKAFEDNMKKAKKRNDWFKKSVKTIGVAVAGAFAVKKVFEYGKAVIMAADKQLKAETQVRQALNSTAYAAGFSANELKKTAGELQGLTLYGDEDILQGVTSNLLTFTNIAGNEFQDAQKVILDMSTLLGQDLSSSAIQVGKALNDPVKGITALSRVGVSFTEQQKQVISQLVATGDVAGAQKVIIAELNKEFGGQAAAAAKAGLGPLQQLKNAWGDIGENIGKKLIPVINKVAQWFLGQLPKLGKGFRTVKQGVIDVINYFINLYNESLAVRAAVEFIKFAFKNIFDYARFVLKNLADYFRLLGKITAVALNPKKWGTGELKNAYANLINGLKDNFIELGQDLKQNFEETLAGLNTKKAYEIGKSMGESMSDGIKDGFKGRGDFIPGEIVSKTVESGQVINTALKESSEESKTAFEVMAQKQKEAVDNFVNLGKSADEWKKQMIDAVETSEGGLNDFKKSLINTVRENLKAYLVEAIAGQVSKALSTFPPPLGPIIAGAAAGGAALAFNKLVPALATGGIATGPTLAMVGDNPNANTDPEVISPLSKLNNLMGSKNININVTGKVRGHDLELILNRHTNYKNRIG